MATWITDKGKFAREFSKATAPKEQEDYDSDGSLNISDISDGSLREDIGDLLRLNELGIMEIDPKDVEEMKQEFNRPNRKKTARKRPSEQPPPVKIAKNRFVLPDNAEDKETVEEPVQNQKKDPPVPKIPPIMITDTKLPWCEISKLLSSVILDFFSADHKNGKYKVVTTTSDDYRSAVAMLTDNKIEFHSFIVRDEKVFKYVIRGLPTDLSIKELEDELKRLGFPIQKVVQMKSGKDNRPIPLFLVHQLSRKGAKDPYDLEHLFHLKVFIEKYRNGKRVLQCYACQGFHHGSRTCGHPPKCVKCGEGHRSSDCPKPKEAEPTCANCQGKHTANYKGCSKYPKPFIRREDRRPPTRAWGPPRAEDDFPALPTQNQRTSSSQEEKFEKIMEKFEKMMTQMASMMENLLKIVTTLLERSNSPDKNGPIP